VTMIAIHKRRMGSWVSQLWTKYIEGSRADGDCDVRININGAVNGANSIHV